MMRGINAVLLLLLMLVTHGLIECDAWTDVTSAAGRRAFDRCTDRHQPTTDIPTHASYWLDFLTTIYKRSLAGKSVSNMTPFCVEWGVKPRFGFARPMCALTDQFTYLILASYWQQQTSRASPHLTDHRSWTLHACNYFVTLCLRFVCPRDTCYVW